MLSYREEKSAGGSAAAGGLSFELVEADKEILCRIGDKTRQRREQVADIFLGSEIADSFTYPECCLFYLHHSAIGSGN